MGGFGDKDGASKNGTDHFPEKIKRFQAQTLLDEGIEPKKLVFRQGVGAEIGNDVKDHLHLVDESRQGEPDISRVAHPGLTVDPKEAVERSIGEPHVHEGAHGEAGILSPSSGIDADHQSGLLFPCGHDSGLEIILLGHDLETFQNRLELG